MAQYTEINLNAANSSSQSEETGSENQLAAAYIVYMMVGSFFKSCKLQSPIRMNSLRVHYAEMRVNSQLSVERRVEKDFEERFASYLDLFAESQCLVSIRDSGDVICLTFDTGFEQLKATIDREGQYDFELHR